MKTIKKISVWLWLFALGASLTSCSKDDDQKGNTMDVYSFSPNSPATMKFNAYVLVEYNYNIDNAEGARMWVIPLTDGEKSPGYLYSSSNVYTGSGGRQVGFSIEDSDDPVTVDQLWVLMQTPDQDETLFEQFIDVNYTFDK